MKQRILCTSGVAAPLLFVFMTVLGGAMRPGYSHAADTVSELLSPGSPNRLLLSALFTAYALLVVAFGVGMLQVIRGSEQSARVGSIGASLFIIAGLVNVAIATVFPQDPWGTARTFAGQMHMILSAVIGVLQMLSILLLGIWFRRTGSSSGLAAYSFLTVGMVFLSAGFLLARVGTPLMGIAERISVLVGLLWTFTTALWMVRNSARESAIA